MPSLLQSTSILLETINNAFLFVGWSSRAKYPKSIAWGGVTVTMFPLCVIHSDLLLRAFCGSCCYSISSTRTTPTKMPPYLILVCSNRARYWWLSFIVFIAPVSSWTNLAIQRSFFVTIIAIRTIITKRFSSFILICSFLT